jgi:hypothetical protein
MAFAFVELPSHLATQGDRHPPKRGEAKARIRNHISGERKALGSAILLRTAAAAYAVRNRQHRGSPQKSQRSALTRDQALTAMNIF